MSEEIEAKVRIDDPAEFRRRLESMAGRGAGPVLEVNRLFDDARGALGRAGSALRLREERPMEGNPAARVRLTFKGPRQDGRLKQRPEFETDLADAEAMTAILHGLDLAEVFRYEKHRTTWHVGPCEVVLDELPHLGWFAEVEGPNEAAVLRGLAEVGLADRPLISRTYIDLLVEYLTAHGAKPTVAVFGA
jgi:adenylate cyclase, class 2